MNDDVVVNGETDPAWSRVRDAFAANLAEGLDDGASLAVSVHGVPVVDIWGGSDPLTGRAWQRDSVTIGFSVTKGVAAIALLQLVERGLVDLDAPVASYWPEFGSAGKARMTVRELASHRVGLPAIELDDILAVADWQLATSTLAAQAPQYDTTRYFAYHALSFGFLVGEVVQRASGRLFSDYVQANIADPLGLDLWVGQPASAEGQYLAGLTDDVELAPPVVVPDGPPIWNVTARSGVQLMPLFHRVGGVQGTEPFNEARFRAATIPAGNGVTNGRSLARMYGACLGEVDGVRLLQPTTIAEAARDQAAGVRKPGPGADPWESGIQQLWGIGFEISNYENPMLGPGSFGHSGMGGRLGFGQLGTGVSFGYVSQRMAYPAPGTFDPRWNRILPAVRDALAG